MVEVQKLSHPCTNVRENPRKLDSQYSLSQKKNQLCYLVHLDVWITKVFLSQWYEFRRNSARTRYIYQ